MVKRTRMFDSPHTHPPRRNTSEWEYFDFELVFWMWSLNLKRSIIILGWGVQRTLHPASASPSCCCTGAGLLPRPNSGLLYQPVILPGRLGLGSPQVWAWAPHQGNFLCASKLGYISQLQAPCQLCVLPMWYLALLPLGSLFIFYYFTGVSLSHYTPEGKEPNPYDADFPVRGTVLGWYSLSDGCMDKGMNECDPYLLTVNL